MFCEVEMFVVFVVVSFYYFKAIHYVVKMHKLPSAFSLGEPLLGKSVHKLRDQFVPEHNANTVFLMLK